MRTHTEDTLVQDMGRLGVEDGDSLFVHSSFTSLGRVEGGAATVVAALERATAPDGLILMPSFNLAGKGLKGREKMDVRAKVWNPHTTPSTVGYLTEYFRTMPGACRSDHYSHSVAALGKEAQWFTGNHRSREGLPSQWDRAPWGRTFGAHSPMAKAYRRGGKLLFIGADHRASTYIHVIETLLWEHLKKQRPDAPFPALNREALGARWDREGPQRTGLVGDAFCRLMSIRRYVDTLKTWVLESPARYAAKWVVEYFPQP